MAGYSDSTDTGAADALDQGGDQQDPESQQEDSQEGSEESGRDDTLFLPQDFPNAANLKKGDKLTFTVIGTGQDGSVEVECMNMGGKDSGWKSDLRKSMA